MTGHNKHLRSFFYFMAGLNFIMVLIYNFLTPYMSDDLWYDIGAMKSLPELLAESVNSYMTWGGRSVADFLLRLSFCFPKGVFNVVNSLLFVALSLLIYLNIEGRKKYDVLVYGYVMIFMWLFTVSFDQTILWVSGACNYLWTGVIIMSFVTLYRIKSELPTTVPLCVGVFFLGLLAGWCNENTSGGALLLVLSFIWLDKRRPVIWELCGMIGCVIGILIMITAPGVRARAAERAADEEHTGMLAYLGRFLKLNDAVMRNLAILFIIIIVLTIYHILKGKSVFELRYIFIYAAVAVITVYVLMATVIPMDRALFGAGVFIIIAAIQAITYIPREDIYMTTLKYSAPVILGLYLMVTYISCGADLFRITRELNEREEYAEQQKAEGNVYLTLPKLRPDWNNRYTYIYNNGNDVDEDDDSYGNSIYKEYYGLKDVHGIDRADWTE